MSDAYTTAPGQSPRPALNRRWPFLPFYLAGAGAALVLLTAAGWTKLQQASLCAQEYEPAPPGMVFVPAGEFWMGSDAPDAEPDERPLRKVFLPAFYIDRCEVTNRRYQMFKPSHRYPPGEDEFPATFVHKAEAEEFCHWAGRRLPTNQEWEKAARGTNGWAYPWGNEFEPGRANIDRRSAQVSSAPINRTTGPSASCLNPASASASVGKLPVGAFPQGASPYGCQDMAGNAWEWVSDIWIDPTPLGLTSSSTTRGILRGGAYNYSPRQARTSYQGFEALTATCHDVGFRCAMNAVPKRN